MRPDPGTLDAYDLNIGAFIREHPALIVCAGFEGVGYRARPRQGEGPWVSALTLDELAAKVEEEGNTR